MGVRHSGSVTGDAAARRRACQHGCRCGSSRAVRGRFAGGSRAAVRGRPSARPPSLRREPQTRDCGDDLHTLIYYPLRVFLSALFSHKITPHSYTRAPERRGESHTAVLSSLLPRPFFPSVQGGRGGEGFGAWRPSRSRRRPSRRAPGRCVSGVEDPRAGPRLRGPRTVPPSLRTSFRGRSTRTRRRTRPRGVGAPRRGPRGAELRRGTPMRALSSGL